MFDKKIFEMLDLQSKLNLMTSGENWRDGITDKGKVISWRRCMYIEMVEAIDSTPWKHWKNIDGETDILNLRVEIVDIWHFLQSELLKFQSIKNSTLLIRKYVNEKCDIKLPIKWNKEKNLELNNFLKPFEDFIILCFDENKDINYLELLIKQFFICLNLSGMNFQDLYNLYIGKNVLNKFRQDHGYKEGTYKKIWNNGKEDNVSMQKFIGNNKDFSFTSLYEYLEQEYNI